MARDSHDPTIRMDQIALPTRGPGAMAYLDIGDPTRAVDAVFVHANGFNALTYRHLLAPLGARRRILAVDQRGHGATTLSDKVEGRRDWLDLRDDLLAFLTAMDLHKVVLAGHSMGSTASLMAAAREPDRCRRLALVDPVILPTRLGDITAESPMVAAALRRRAIFPSREEAMASYRGRGAFKTWPEEVLADYVTAGFRDLPTGEVTLTCTPQWEASGFAAHGHDPWDSLRNTRCEIDILRAEFGSTFRVEEGDPLDEPRVRVRTIAGASHFLPMEFPELVRAAIDAAIDADPAEFRTAVQA